MPQVEKKSLLFGIALYTYKYRLALLVHRLP
jgi:hypothetical protein